MAHGRAGTSISAVARQKDYPPDFSPQPVDEAEAEDLRQRIERLTKPLNKPLTKLLTKQVTKPLTKIKHVAQEEIHPRQAYGQIPKWRAKEIAEKKKG